MINYAYMITCLYCGQQYLYYPIDYNHYCPNCGEGYSEYVTVQDL